MITIFNRRKVARTSSHVEQAALRGRLERRHIAYKLKVIDYNNRNLTADTRAVYGSTTLLRTDDDYDFIIYVQKRDFERAQAALADGEQQPEDN